MPLLVLEKISIGIYLLIETNYIQLQSATDDIFPHEDFA